MKFEIRDIELGYKGGDPLVKGLSLEAKPASLTALVGRNGVGKSTLMRTMACLVDPRRGDVLIDGVSVNTMTADQLATKVAYVSTEIVRVAHLRVYDVVAYGRSPYTSWQGTLSKEDKRQIETALEAVSMTKFRDTDIDTLSDGERQRVMIARSVAQDTPIILLDEPTAFLDIVGRYQIVELLKSLAQEYKKTIIFSTHDLQITSNLADMLWVMSSKGVVSGTPSEIYENGALEEIFIGSNLDFDKTTNSIYSKK